MCCNHHPWTNHPESVHRRARAHVSRPKHRSPSGESGFPSHVNGLVYLGLFLTIGGRRVPSTAGPSVWSIECEPVDHLPAPRHSHSLGDGGGQADHTRSSVNPYSQVTMRRNWSFPDGNIGIVRWAGRTSSSSTRSRSFRARPRQFAHALAPQCRSCEPPCRSRGPRAFAQGPPT